MLNGWFTLSLPLVLVTVALLLHHHGRRKSKSNRERLPGPKGGRILGNMFDIPRKNQWTKFNNWKKVYGDVIGLRVLGKSIVILNSRTAIVDLLEKRSAAYSDRPQLTVIKRCTGMDWTIFMLPYNEELAIQRRLMNQSIGPRSHAVYQHILQRLALEFAATVEKDPEGILEHLEFHIASFLLRITYGHKAMDKSDKLMKLMQLFETSVGKLGALGSHPIDFFPILANLPHSLFGKKFATNVEGVRHFATSALTVPFDAARSRYTDQSILTPSAIHTLFEEHTLDDGKLENEPQMRAATGAIYTAGFNTTHSTLRTFLLVMMCNPDKQRRAQEELDKRKDTEKMPTFQDRSTLPYLDAVYLETLRWGPAAPLALPHQCSEEDSYNGMHIPAGSMIMPNSWACLHDPVDYPDPMAFRPERFLTKDEKQLDHTVLDARGMAFGYGRRVCPGRYIAEDMLWITMVTLLTLFDISKPLDENGKMIEPDLGYSSGMVVSYPLPFKCRISLRSSAAAVLLHHASQNARADL